jgi:hypothetical protein
MKFSTKSIIGLLLSLLYTKMCAQVPSTSLGIHAIVTIHDCMSDLKDNATKAPGKYFSLNYKLYFENKGSGKLKIPTRGFHRMTSGDQVSCVSKLEWEIAISESGEKIIQSDYELGFVDLRPGEVALITWKEIEFRKERLGDLKVAIAVPTEFGLRYQAWFGVDETQAKVIFQKDDIEDENEPRDEPHEPTKAR